MENSNLGGKKQGAIKRGLGTSSILMLLYYLSPLQSDCIVTSWGMQFTFGDKREVYLFDESEKIDWKRKEARGKKIAIYILGAE